MAVYCLGSINADHVYSVPHLPAPGETLAADGFEKGLGGKGANQSVAAARAGARAIHIGAVGDDGGWMLDALTGYGVDVRHVAKLDVPTGHAIINVDPSAENSIVILGGANRALTPSMLDTGLADASAGDVLLLQNETNLQAEAAEAGQALGLRVLYSAAPFDAGAVRDVLPHIDMLLLNEVEARQLEEALGAGLGDLGVAQIVVTLGARGARWIDAAAGESFDVPGVKVRAVDTTGAGDTFAGYLAAGLDEGLNPRAAMELAGRAAAIQVTRPGAAAAIPLRGELG